jgi:hypothetical protein
MLTFQQAFDRFNEEVRPAVIATYGDSDLPAMREAWNNFTDEQTSERHGFNSLQYHYCPSVDDDMPDDDLEFILDAMGVTMTAKPIDARTDRLMDDMPAGSTHYRLTFKRGSKRFSTLWSQGPAITSRPDLIEVLQALFMDASAANENFEDWANGLGYSSDSRKAERIYKACHKLDAKLENMFSREEREDLAEMLNDH